MKWVFFVLTLSVLIQCLSCAKEYSFEGAVIDSTIVIRDTVRPELPYCTLCDSYTDPARLNEWSLKAENAKACGIIDTAIATLDRAAFTFFGPSACSTDTGLVMTVYLENFRLDQDWHNRIVNKVSFFYYDHVGPSYIYISSAAYPFSLTIDDYNHQTRLLTGRFEGFAKRTNGINAVITEGRFRVKVL